MRYELYVLVVGVDIRFSLIHFKHHRLFCYAKVRIFKLEPSQHRVSGHYRPADETSLAGRWCHTFRCLLGTYRKQ